MSQAEHVLDPRSTAIQQAIDRTAPTGAITLIFYSPTLPGQLARVLDGPLEIGRAPSADVVLDDEAISRVHARVRPVAGGIEVEDLQSRNGTFVGGDRIVRAVAPIGALIRIGDAMCRVASLGEEWQPVVTDGPLVGGAALAMVRRLIALVGPSELPVLVLGETGTGKDAVARLLHEASRRRGQLVAVNCASLPAALVESEIFGHVRGAFTGADRPRKGLFQAAAGGTLFLDEVGELPLAAQATLLRVLEDGVVRPVGGEASQRVDVRIVSATNRDLGAAVEAGRFRGDLLARLAAVEVHTPPLRTRPEDLPALTAFLLSRSGAPLPLSADALEAMSLYAWPYNVRELDNVLRAAALRGQLSLANLPSAVQRCVKRDTIEPAVAPGVPDRATLEGLLRSHAGNIRRLSQKLGIARGHVYRLLERNGLDADLYRAPKRRGPKVAHGGSATDE